MTKKNTIVQILGPTGVGKSKIAIFLAKHLEGEIVSADSIQVYKGFNVGTAKITEEEKEGIVHHLIDVYNGCEQFNTAIFLMLSYEAVKSIIIRKMLPLICGGTALYLKSMIKGIFPESGQKRVNRNDLVELANKKGLDYLWQKLNRIDREYAEQIGKNDLIRIVRGLEIYYNNNKTPSDLFKNNQTPFADFRFIRIGLNLPRQELYNRINERVENMIYKGLQLEVKQLMEIYPCHCPPFKSVGYKEMILFLQGKIKWTEAVDLIKQHSRNLAKRQLTWFKQEKDIVWFHPDDREKILRYLQIECDQPCN